MQDMNKERGYYAMRDTTGEAEGSKVQEMCWAGRRLGYWLCQTIEEISKMEKYMVRKEEIVNRQRTCTKKEDI